MPVSKSLFIIFLLGSCYGAPQYLEPEIKPPGHIPPSENAVNVDLKATVEEPEKSVPSKSEPVPEVKKLQPPLPKPESPSIKPQPSLPKPQPSLSKPQNPSPAKVEQKNSKVDDSELQKVETKPLTSEESKPEPAKSAANYKYNDCLSDTLFVVDSTSSVGKIFEKHRNYVSNVIKDLDISPGKNHIGIIVYSSKYRQKVKVSLADPQDKGNITKVISNLPFFSGVTATGQALRLAQQELKNRRSDVVTNLVVITDGFSYDYIDEPIKELHQVNNLRTFAVVLSEACRKFELLMISETEDNLFQGDESYKDLLKRLQQCNEKSGGDSITSNEENEEEDNGVESEDKSGENEKSDEEKSDSGSSSESKNEESDEEESKSNSSNSSKSEEDEKENGSEEEKPKDCSFDVAFVIDASGSLKQRYLKQVEMASELVDIFGENSNFALVKYSGKRQIRVPVPLGSNKTATEFKSILTKQRFMGGTTFTDLALDKAFDEFNGPGRNGDSHPVAIVFTDGFSRTDPLPNAKKLHDKSIPVFAIGVSDGHTVNERELRDIATDPAHVYLDTNFQALKDTLVQLSKTC